MSTLPARFHLPASPVAPAANQVVGEHFRITVLTPRLLRLEYSPSGRFEDRPTQMVLNRDLGPVEFRVVEDAAGLHLFTDAVILDYDKGPFSSSGLTVRLAGAFDFHSQWRYGVGPDAKWGQLHNLGGTARTLDAADGPCDLDDGIVAHTGFAVLDDSATMAITDDGWVAPRIEGNQDLYYFGYGHDAQAAVRDFYRLTGPTPLLPRFALGNWWSRYFRYSAAEYQGLIERFAAEKLPFSVAVVDMDWHWVDIDPGYGNGWTGYSWNTDLFPDPPAFLAWLRDHGLKVSLNVHPADGVRAYEDRYPQLARALGIDPETRQPVNFDIADPDFLLPYLEQLHHPMEEEGVDFWWLDWQQGSHTSVAGLDPLWMLNHYHYLDNARTGKRPLTFSRYAGPGSHRYPIGFSGDTINSWASLDFQPYFTATAANIGFGWWSHDIGGHLWGIRDDELVTRWFQFGTFSPINRLHSTNNIFAGKEPWKYNGISREVMGTFLRLRHRMIPYLYTMNERAHRLGEPLLRPVYYADYRPESLACRNAYLFGTELLVAAITTPVDESTLLAGAKAWLPAGEWIDFFTGVRYSGGRTVTLHRPISGYPVLARAGAIVPLTAQDDYAVSNPSELEVHVFAGADGSFDLYEDDDAAVPRSVVTRISYDQAAGVVTITAAVGDLDVVPATRRYRLVVHGLDDVAAQGWETSGEPGTLVVDLGQVATAAGASVRLTGERRPSDNRVEARVFDLIAVAQLPYAIKDAVWAILQEETTAARRVAALDALDLDAPLASALNELLLADA